MRLTRRPSRTIYPAEPSWWDRPPARSKLIPMYDDRSPLRRLWDLLRGRA